MDRKHLLTDQLEFYRDLGVTHLNLGVPTAESLEAGIRECERCEFSAGRKGYNSGSGSLEADLMFIVDALSEEDVKAGEPLSGEAGELLRRIIRAIELDPGDVFVTNAVKCCPGNLRKPSPAEIDACRPWLMKQVSLVNPLVIVPLGNVAAHSVLSTADPITALRGRFHHLGRYPVMPTFHPEYLLHNPGAKSQVWQDMKMVRERLRSR